MKEHVNILIVDDDADDRQLFADIVKEMDRSIACTVAKDGLHALDLLQNKVAPLPDLIFLDLRMPRLGGKSCLLEIKKDDRLKEIPVIIYTASREVEESKELKRLGAVHFISKPDNPEEVYFLLSCALEEQWYHLH